MPDRYKYTGDPTGTELTPGATYRRVSRGIDTVTLQLVNSTKRVEITKEEFDSHVEIGTLTPKE